MKVAILLSTYNGKKYIPEQIDSLLNQTFKDEITIFVRDDGSRDGSIDYLKGIQLEYNRNISVVEGDNIGPQRSFLHLIQLAPVADYYFYCDQDDIWKLDKIEKSVQYMEELEKPYKLYCSNYAVTDMDMNILQEEAINIVPEFRVLKALFYNLFPGCTMGFNQKLLMLLQKINLTNVMMHDSITLALAIAVGEVAYDNESTIYHRIHEENVVGIGHKKIKPMKWIREKSKLLIKGDDYDMSNLANQFLLVGQDLMDERCKEDLILLRDFKKSYKNTFLLLMHNDTNDAFGRTMLSIRCKILFHVF